MSEIDLPREKVSLFELAWTFNHIALASFGGGLSAWSREVLVVEKRWMGEEEFLSAMTMCRILPGANQVNMAVFVGTKIGGLLGADGDLRPVPDAHRLHPGDGIHLFPLQRGARGEERPSRRVRGRRGDDPGHGDQDRPEVPEGTRPVLLFAATFVLNGILRWPLPVTLAIVAPVSLIWAWPRKRAA
jgi:chromate transporter